MRSRWNLPIYLVYVVLCLSIAGYLVLRIGVVLPWNHPYQVTAVFKSGDGILQNNEVYLNGVQVGRVESVEARGGEAYVHMRVDDQRAVPLHGDAGAVVRKKNLLGETYIELTRGAGKDTMATGSTIPPSRTFSPVDIDQVLAILDPETRNRLTLLLGGAGDGLLNQGKNLNAESLSMDTLVTQLQGPATELEARKAQVNAVVLELESLYTTLAQQRDQVRQEFGTWSDVMGQLANQEKAIGGTLQQADSFLQSTDQLLNGQVGNLRSTLDQLPAAIGSAGSFLNNSNDILGSLSVNRKLIHDVFPDLQSSFGDTDPNSPIDPILHTHQHFWSVYSISCTQNCSSQGTGTAFSLPAAPNDSWAAAMSAGG